LLPREKKTEALPEPKRLTAKKEVEILEKALEQEREKSQNYFKQLNYLQADFENYKKRVQREYYDVASQGKEQLLKNLLSITDELEIALKESKKSKNFEAVVEGLEMILKKMCSLLETEGLQKIEAVGKQFDPNLHEAIIKVDKKGKEVGKILEEIRSGYIFNGKVIRPSLVKVATSPTEKTPRNEEMSEDE